MKRTQQLTLGFIFLAVFIFSLLVFVKPGASYFYKKSQIPPQNIVDAGNAYEYQFKINTHIYDPATLLVLENQKVLDLCSLEYTESGGKSCFTLNGSTAEQVIILFVPATSSNPAGNGHTYRIYIRPYFISSDWGSSGVLLLLFAFFVFKRFKLAEPASRKVLLEWPAKAARQLRLAAVRPKSFSLPSKSFFIQSLVNIVLMAFLYVFMEWLFFITKPSFMDMLSFGEKVRILLITGLIVALIGLVTELAMFLLDILITPVFPSFRKYIYQLPAAFLAACLCLILFDNFTYTIFNFGIVDTKTVLRALYALGFVVVLIYILNKLATATTAALKQGSHRFTRIAAVTLFAVSGILAGFTFKPPSSTATQQAFNSGRNSRPNIILLNTDGLNANSMSAYGYQRDTTPFITELAKTSLIGENNFTNAYVSEGSETSTLTGKLAFDTHVLNPPDTLKGDDRYQSLPRILKTDGYRTVSLGVPYFVDVNTINFQDAFNEVNCKENPTASPLSAYSYDNEIYILTAIEGRVSDRLKHIFFIQKMLNPMEEVTQANSERVTDEQRIDCLHTDLAQAKKTGQPLFAHIHLMGTHGEFFNPTRPVFSKGEDQSAGWMTDFYDDSILDFDSQVQALVQYLKDHGQWNNTILILYTDHGQEWVTKNRLPLIIHFPNDQHAGPVTENTQNIDIAPTLLDYLGIQEPTWMYGSSLFGKLDAARLIIAAFKTQAENDISRETFKPPFYQFTFVSVIQCQNWYLFDLTDKAVKTGKVAGYVAPCSASSLDSQEALRGKISKVLIGLGYKLPDW